MRTSHGYEIPGQPYTNPPEAKEPCGGVGHCEQCLREAASTLTMVDTDGHPIMQPISKDEEIRLLCLEQAVKANKNGYNIVPAAAIFEDYVKNGYTAPPNNPCKCGREDLKGMSAFKYRDGEEHSTCHCLNPDGSEIRAILGRDLLDGAQNSE